MEGEGWRWESEGWMVGGGKGEGGGRWWVDGGECGRVGG